MTLLAAALTFTPRKRPADREPIAEPLPRFRVPMQWVRYESGEHKAFAVVLVMLPKTPWMLKQDARP